MRGLLHLILLLVFTLYVQSAPAAWALYAANGDDIAAAYCVNSARPSCHGRCHMAKSTTKGGPGQTENVVVVKLLPFIPVASITLPLISTSINYRPSAGECLIPGFPADIDHPPAREV